MWIFRAVWFLLPLSAGQALTNAVGEESSSLRTTTLVLAWVLWAAVFLASFAPHPLTLTGTRIVAPLAIALSLWSFSTGAATGGSLFAPHALAAALLAKHELLGDRYADGASYGDERRMLLRPPWSVQLAGLPIAWFVAVAAVPGVLLLSTQRWVAGGVLTLIGLVGGPFGVRALHQLSRRWVVFVPTGFVLHDLSVITEPVLFRRTAIERLGAAIKGTPARDLTHQALGLQIECELADPAPIGVIAGRGRAAELTDTRRFLFCPSRPGELLDEAERRDIAVDG